MMDTVKSFINASKNNVFAVVKPAPPVDNLVAKLDSASIPVTSDPCRECPNPCDEHEYRHEEWPSQMLIDHTSDMLGAVKPYFRQVVISTGKSDWEREVTEARGTLAANLNDLSISGHKSSSSSNGPKVPGVFNSDSATRLSVINGSHRTTSEDASKETVLIFPDYKMVTEVDSTSKGAETLARGFLDAELSKAGSDQPQIGSKSWILPYQAVILLCSHKRRDNKCAIAAPVLKRALTTELESVGWEVHDQLEDPECLEDSAIEDIPGTTAEREAVVEERLKNLCSPSVETKRALIIFCSHIGGHKFAGNVIIYTPHGSGVWYGRVSSHQTHAVMKTITEGKIYPTLLRGGVNITRPKGKTLLDW
ncbi:hypothetical protein FRC04_000207 [Tulasnella sp. 424]|nr:hypothetical protein FRC04_000207 [Tulasnella sp. 424]KAG8982071.1 hypothetical protein FRC05_000213 [Tulasnella sp. 425]